MTEKLNIRFKIIPQVLFLAFCTLFGTLPAFGMKDNNPKKQEVGINFPEYKNYSGDGCRYCKNSINTLLDLLNQYKNALNSANTQKTNSLLKTWGTSLITFVSTENAITACGIKSQDAKDIQKKCFQMESCSFSGGLGQLLELSSPPKPKVLLSDLITTVTLLYEETQHAVKYLNNPNEELASFLSDLIDQLKEIQEKL